MKDEICEVRIQTEGYQGGYTVRIVGEDDTKTYWLHRDDLADIVQKIQDRAAAKGDVSAHWKKVA